MKNFFTTQRLIQTLSGVCPVNAVSVGRMGEPESVLVDFHPDATSPQRRAAKDALAKFDWSDKAHDEWTKQRERFKSAELTGPQGHLVRALAAVLVAELNELRDKAKLPKRTAKEIQAAIVAKINGGGS
jgi:hypothetical protein